MKEGKGAVPLRAFLDENGNREDHGPRIASIRFSRFSAINSRMAWTKATPSPGPLAQDRIVHPFYFPVKLPAHVHAAGFDPPPPLHPFGRVGSRETGSLRLDQTNVFRALFLEPMQTGLIFEPGQKKGLPASA